MVYLNVYIQSGPNLHDPQSDEWMDNIEDTLDFVDETGKKVMYSLLPKTLIMMDSSARGKGLLERLKGSVAEKGHEIAQVGYGLYCKYAHKWWHPGEGPHENDCPFTLAFRKDEQSEIFMHGRAVISSVLGRKPIVYSPPSHAWNDNTAELAYNNGFYAMTDRAFRDSFSPTKSYEHFVSKDNLKRAMLDGGKTIKSVVIVPERSVLGGRLHQADTDHQYFHNWEIAQAKVAVRNMDVDDFSIVVSEQPNETKRRINGLVKTMFNAAKDISGVYHSSFGKG